MLLCLFTGYFLKLFSFCLVGIIDLMIIIIGFMFLIIIVIKNVNTGVAKNENGQKRGILKLYPVKTVKDSNLWSEHKASY